jgi:hypothetical protein
MSGMRKQMMNEVANNACDGLVVAEQEKTLNHSDTSAVF